ncbi:hypothetical protein [Halobacterium sp. KA-6]|uniref:hypothetical protein n=1 Tax=Halobacterium sp. KA-6 TaxID=2896368 RepID=UPI001E4C9199|nr:hypothetical protein [Halobacterium sp. KA-6]MCD2204431.1 hypothetical protein [Halobacterium sp. KA-6]
MTDEDLPPAVIDHSPSPAAIYCSDCAYTVDIDDEAREDLDESQVGDCVICDGCGEDIAELVDDAGNSRRPGWFVVTTYRCDSCGGESEDCYRCSECRADMAKQSETTAIR